MEETVKGVKPENTIPSETAVKKVPKAGVTTYHVRTRGVASFRRAGITFGPDPIAVDATSLTDEQKIELLNTKELTVDEGGGERHGASETVGVAHAMRDQARGEAAEAHPPEPKSKGR